jgi:ribosomal protein S12 methylthiotransferase accessory factor
VTGPIDVPSIECIVAECQIDGSYKAYAGCGTHPDARVAVLRALTEAAQSRISFIQGGREDLPEMRCEVPILNPDSLFAIGAKRSFSQVHTHEYSTIDEDLQFLLYKLSEAGLHQIVVVDLTNEHIQIPVVRVIVPYAENWPIFHLHLGRAHLGPRILSEFGKNTGEMSLFSKS